MSTPATGELRKLGTGWEARIRVAGKPPGDVEVIGGASWRSG